MGELRRTISLDPPWAERGGGKVKRGADKHYPVMSVKKILACIMQSGMWTPNTHCCSVWMWATNNYLVDALWLMDRLGAHYVTNIVWVKAKVIDGQYDTGEKHGGISVAQKAKLVLPQAPGLGQRVRMCHELLLYGRIGKVPVPEPADRLPSTIYAPRGRHSKKPQEAFHRMETHDGPGSRLEFFAREPQPGWDAWGNEIDDGDDASDATATT